MKTSWVILIQEQNTGNLYMPKKKNNKNNNIEEMEAIKSFNNATEKEKEDFIIFLEKLLKSNSKK